MSGRRQPVAAEPWGPALRIVLDCLAAAGSPEALSPAWPTGLDPVSTAVLEHGWRAVRISPADLSSAVCTPALAIDAEGRPITLLPGEFRSAGEAATDRIAWRFHPRLVNQVGGLRGMATTAQARLRWTGPVTVLVTGLLAAVISCLLPVVAVRLGGERHWTQGLLVVGLALPALAFLYWIRDRAATTAQRDLQFALEPALWDRVLDPDSRALRGWSPAALVSAAGLLPQLRSLVMEAVLDFLLMLTLAGSTFVLLAAVDGWLAITVLAVLAVGLGCLCWRAVATVPPKPAGTAEAGALLQAAFAGLDEVHLYARENAILDRAAAKLSVARSDRIEEHLAAIKGVLWTLLPAAVLFAAWYRGTGPADTLIACGAVAQLVLAIGRVDNLTRLLFVVGRGLVGETLAMLRATDRPVPDCRLPAGNLLGEIEVAAACLTYGGADRPALDEISLRIEPGEFVAVVGPSGAGKSSLLRLIAGLESPQQGEVRCDGRPLSSLILTTVRAQIGFVPQDAEVPRGTVRSVVLGTDRLDLDRLAWEALRDVGLFDQIRALPMGLSTGVLGGTNGFAASQLQLMLLARAFARRPRLLLLDEIDAVAKEQLTDHLRALPMTRVVVTHSPHLARAADRVIVLDGGAVVESGRYDELMAGRGALDRLFNSGSFIDNS